MAKIIMAKYLHLGWPAYGRMASALAEKIHKSGQRFDVVVAIARGGIPLSMVISDRLEAHLDIMTVKSYTGLRGQRERPKILSTLNNSVKGRRVLIVDDLIEEGSTMAAVEKYIRAMHPRLVMTAALFRKPWSKFDPDFYHKEVDRWVIFPWEETEFRNMKKRAGIYGTATPTAARFGKPQDL